jgi:PEGA domain
MNHSAPFRFIAPSLAGWLCLVCTANTAHAETLAPPAPARSLTESLAEGAKAEYEAGRLLYGEGDYASATLKFERAYELSKDPRLLWNMAVAEKQQRHYARVHALVSRYLTEAGPSLGNEDRAEAELLLSTIDGFLGKVTVLVEPSPATLFIDDAEVATLPSPTPIRVDMGPRQFRITKPGFKAFNLVQKVVGGADSRIEARLSPDVREGRFRVIAGPKNSIYIDGKLVGSGEWNGLLASGTHSLLVSEPGKRPYRADIAIEAGQLATSRVALEPEPIPPPPVKETSTVGTWPWVLVGVAVVVAGGVTAYALTRPEEPSQATPVAGTLDPGYWSLGL